MNDASNLSPFRKRLMLAYLHFLHIVELSEPQVHWVRSSRRIHWVGSR